MVSKATCFFTLPEDIACDIFSQWIDTRDVLNLDTALLNRYQRQMFLEMIREDKFVLRGSEDLVLSSYLNWLGHRRFKVDKVALIRSFLEDTDHASRIDLSKLESLSFRSGCGHKCKAAEMTFFERLLSNFTVKADPYMKLFVRCGNLKHIDFGEEAHTAFGKIGMFCAKLQSVRAVHCNGLNDTAVENIAQHCRGNIRTVTLCACDQITSASVYAIAESCPNLTYIDLSYGSALSERCLITLAERCPLLEHINFEGLMNISDKVIAAVAQHCKNLAFFNIDYYKGMSHDGINPVALQTIADSCPKIADFLAPDFNYTVRQGAATLRLKGIYTRLHKLQNILLNSPVTVGNLVATGCKYFNDDCLALAAQRYRGNLHAVAMHSCEDITDAGLQQLATHCPELGSVNAAGCEISDLAVTALVQRCPHLHSLQLCKCEHLTDNAVQDIATSLPALTALDLNACPKVTDDALTYLAQHSRSLRELNVTHCPGVTKPAIVALTAQLPELTCHSFWDFYLK